MPAHTDTIFALSSGRPPAAIAVVRISGPRAGAALQALTGRIPERRKAVLGRVRDPLTTEIIDEALVLWFPGPNSETGEDTAELQLHGGRAVIAGVLGALGRLEGLRPAEAGEFTRRALENGKLDLTAIEGLADLVAAETEGQRRQAFRQMKGLLGNRAEAWRAKLIEALALVAARIDFSDEADVPEDLVAPALRIAQGLRGEIADALAGATRGERLRDGLVVAIAGPPNVGKSTLLNRIARREAAIVSPLPGTTRDVIEVHLDLGGYPVTLLDTAGIRDSADPVEQEGIRRARERAAEADLVLWVVEAGAQQVSEDAGVGVDMGSRPKESARDSAPPRAAGYRATPVGSGGAPARKGSSASEGRPNEPFADSLTPVWQVVNKTDLTSARMNQRTERESENDSIVYYVSAKTGEGMSGLFEALFAHAHRYFGTETTMVTRERHRLALAATQQALERALAEGPSGREDIIAEELRLAAQTLGRLTGRVDVEDILEVIFRDFCIGK